MKRPCLTLALFSLVVAACSKKSTETPKPDATSIAPPAASSAVPLGGNAASGMPKSSELMALAKPGAATCAPCFFNGRCALLTEGPANKACCDYVGSKKADAWQGGTSHAGEASECLAMIVDAPYAPAPAKGHLEPLAKPGQACRECFFNTKCEIVIGSGTGACCDYAGGKKAGAWADDSGRSARCLAHEANVAIK